MSVNLPKKIAGTQWESVDSQSNILSSQDHPIYPDSFFLISDILPARFSFSQRPSQQSYKSTRDAAFRQHKPTKPTDAQEHGSYAFFSMISAVIPGHVLAASFYSIN